jgi:hypothetical protein
MFENSLLNLPDIMQYPLVSSYTSTNDKNGEAGRPEKDSGEIEPSTERSRNS